MQSASVPTGDHNPRGHSAAEVLAAIQGRATYTAYDPMEEVDGMTVVIPNQGEGIWLELVTSVDYYLRLFTNEVEYGLEPAEIEALTEADFTEATFTGYTANLLTGGAWSVTPGAPSEATYSAQSFASSIEQTPETIYGYYVTRASNGYLTWYEYLDSPVSISGADEHVTITPRVTLQDTGD